MAARNTDNYRLNPKRNLIDDPLKLNEKNLANQQEGSIADPTSTPPTPPSEQDQSPENDLRGARTSDIDKGNPHYEKYQKRTFPVQRHVQ